MRTLLFLGLAIGAAFMANWFTIERDGDHTRIDINKKEIRSDAKSAIEKGREILDKRERERQANARSADGYATSDDQWPQSTPAQSTGYQNSGYADPRDYGNQPGYDGQPYGGQDYGGQPYGGQAYGDQNYGGPPYENPTPPGGHGPIYPPRSGTPPAPGNPPPWQR